MVCSNSHTVPLVSLNVTAEAALFFCLIQQIKSQPSLIIALMQPLVDTKTVHVGDYGWILRTAYNVTKDH